MAGTEELEWPAPMGHECAGIVQEVGATSPTPTSAIRILRPVRPVRQLVRVSVRLPADPVFQGALDDPWRAPVARQCAPNSSGLRRSQAVLGASARTPKPAWRSAFRLVERDTPGRSRTCARGLGNACQVARTRLVEPVLGGLQGFSPWRAPCSGRATSAMTRARYPRQRASDKMRLVW